jgi:hypothetical protein
VQSFVWRNQLGPPASRPTRESSIERVVAISSVSDTAVLAVGIFVPSDRTDQPFSISILPRGSAATSVDLSIGVCG